jgi:hypothetical protein
MLEILDAAEAEVTRPPADTVLVTASMELVLLVLKLGAKFVCGRGFAPARRMVIAAAMAAVRPSCSIRRVPGHLFRG